MKRTKPMNIYPEIAKCMACKQLNQKDLADLLGISQQAISQKLKGKTEFRRSEMVVLREDFKEVYPEITMDKLFQIFLPQ